MADKDFELGDCKERITWLEHKLYSVEKKFEEKESHYLEQIAYLKEDQWETEKKVEEIRQMDLMSNNTMSTKSSEVHAEINLWKEEAEKWHIECDVLRCKPKPNLQLNEYYELQIQEILEKKQIAHSEAKSLWSENSALYLRLENLVLINKDLEATLEKSNEELLTTIENYKSQLDAMTEHLAAQNDKITKQCDEIQTLKHKMHNKK